MSYHLNKEYPHLSNAPAAQAPGHRVKESVSARQIMPKYTHGKQIIDTKSNLHKKNCRIFAQFVISSNSTLSLIENRSWLN